MARTVTKVDIIPSQTFKITINGLNVYTILNVYYDNQKVDSANLRDLKPRVDSVTSTIGSSNVVLTDNNGKAEFNFTLPQNYTSLVNNTEAALFDALRRDTGVKTLVVVDAASISSNTLPDNFRTVARCYAETTIKKSVQVTFTDVKDWGSINGSNNTLTLANTRIVTI